jgi:hypothetical protein
VWEFLTLMCLLVWVLIDDMDCLHYGLIVPAK